ncbi:MAG: ATP-binding protein [Flavobacteriia bacterium]|jgi:serine/threonine-protein kinase RsbW
MKDGFTIIDSLSIPSDFEAVSQVEILVDNVCNKLGVNEDYYGNVLIAVTEAVNNAIDHGNKRDNSLDVLVAVGDNPNEFCFTVKDQGRGFDYENLPDPTAPENILKENGRGIFLMRNLADVVEFEDAGRSVNIYFNKE